MNPLYYVESNVQVTTSCYGNHSLRDQCCQLWPHCLPSKRQEFTHKFLHTSPLNPSTKHTSAKPTAAERG